MYSIININMSFSFAFLMSIVPERNATIKLGDPGTIFPS